MFNRGLNDLPKTAKVVSSGARTSFNPMSNGFSILLNDLLRWLCIFSERVFFPRHLAARAALLIVGCNMIPRREEGSVFVQPLDAWNSAPLVGQQLHLWAGGIPSLSALGLGALPMSCCSSCGSFLGRS